MDNKKTLPIGTLILFLSVIILIGLLFITLSSPKKTIPPDLIAVLRPHSTPLQPFTLTDQHGQIYTEKKLRRKWSFLFFGYTSCPDICPTTLSLLKRVDNDIRKSGIEKSDVQIILVSVDPDRDRPEILAQYIKYFNDEFIALTGFPDELLKFSRQFGAAYIKEAEITPGNYAVSHASSIFLVDPQARIVATFSPPHKHETITSQYLNIRALFK